MGEEKTDHMKKQKYINTKIIKINKHIKQHMAIIVKKLKRWLWVVFLGIALENVRTEKFLEV